MNELPRIVRFLDTLDAPDSQCPHCGADGRYILRFVVEDGRQLGAMRGCVKLFPVSQIATEELRLQTKLASLHKRFGASAHLNRVDTEAAYAIAAFYAGAITEDRALERVRFAKRANSAKWR